MKKLQIIISFLLFIFAFSVEAKSPPPGTGKADVPANIYIMLDTSGSMSQEMLTLREECIIQEMLQLTQMEISMLSSTIITAFVNTILLETL